MKNFLCISLLILLFSISVNAAPVNFGKQTLGESRVTIDLKNFNIVLTHPELRAKFINDTVRWERNSDNLLTPEALMGIAIKKTNGDVHLEYKGETFIPINKGNLIYSELWIDLFNPGEIKVIEGTKQIDTIRVESINNESIKKTQLIDYSCSPFDITMTGLDNEYVSIGCVLKKIGKFGNETPRLEVTFSSTNLKMQNGTEPPFKIILEDNSPADFMVINQKGETKKIRINAKLPKKLSRMKLAVGFGPYMFSAKEEELSKKSAIAPSLMLYGKFDVGETSSFKFFDAAVIQKTFFNNAGFYFSYDLAEAFDGRVVLNTLLGLQGLHYKYSNAKDSRFRAIYPQGFEVIWKHPFARENEYMTYGMFLSTSSSEDYTNSWFRWGKKYFWELNYIHWKHETSEITMWGVSVGIPLASFF